MIRGGDDLTVVRFRSGRGIGAVFAALLSNIHDQSADISIGEDFAEGGHAQLRVTADNLQGDSLVGAAVGPFFIEHARSDTTAEVLPVAAHAELGVILFCFPNDLVIAAGEQADD